jgi:hypothetical protein
VRSHPLTINQHYWLAARMRKEGIGFQQCTNAFLKCANPSRLQELADPLNTRLTALNALPDPALLAASPPSETSGL